MLAPIHQPSRLVLFRFIEEWKIQNFVLEIECIYRTNLTWLIWLHGPYRIQIRIDMVTVCGRKEGSVIDKMQNVENTGCFAPGLNY